MPPAHELLWITVAMVGARSLAMALNRLIDMGIDARNPRTAGARAAVGAAEPWQAVLAFCAASLARLPRRGLAARPDRALAVADPGRGFVIYPYLKRFTWLCHLWLGAVDALAPVGGWVAVTGQLPWEAWVLGAAVGAWVAGFDLFYSLFDVEIDREQGLHSWATRFGERGVVRRRARVCTLRDGGVPRRGRARPRGRRAGTGSACRGRRRCSPTSTRSSRPGDLRRLTRRSSR